MNPVIIGNATLYLGDCREILPTLPKVDAVITDPPYGISYDPSKDRGQGRRKFSGMIMKHEVYEPIKGDDEPFNPVVWLEMGIPLILWGANHYAAALPNRARWLVWDKREGGNPDSFSDCELAWCSDGNSAKLFHHLWRGICRAGKGNIAIAGAKEHPNQKPIELMEWCLEFVPAEAEVILDPYMGVGTTGVACMNLGRKFIGVEIEEKYFSIACRRIEDAQRQARLFA